MKMLIVFIRWAVLFISLGLWAGPACFSCPQEAHNCTCFISSEGTTFLCPTPIRKQFSIRTIDKKKLVIMQCEQESAESLDLLSNLTFPSFQSFTMESCGSSMPLDKLLARVHMASLRRLTLRSVLTMNMTSKQTHRLTKEVFRGLQDLEVLEINYSKLSPSRDFLMNTRRLRQLTLSSLGLPSIGLKFQFAPRLERLDLSYNSIATLANRPFKHLLKLVVLSLENNLLEHLMRDMFAGLKSLKELDLSGNRISNISKDTFADLPKLTKVTLAQNRIVQIHGELFAYNGLLEEIWLHGNRLQALPDGVFKPCPKLHKVLLHANKLAKLPKNLFQGLQSLENLDMSGNNLSSDGLLEGLFSTLSNLSRLDLSHNNLNNISLALLDNLDNLHELVLSHAGIAHFPNTSGLRLRLLDLSSNRISHLQVEQLLRSEISHIDLSGNQIAHVGFHLKQTLLPGVKQVVNLEQNPIRCDCSNYALISYNHGAFPELQQRLEISQSGLECSNLKGTLVPQIQPQDVQCKVLDNCVEGCQCSTRPAIGQLIVNCSGRNLGSFRAKQLMANLRVKLDLSGNKLEAIDWVPTNLQELSLENNVFKNLDMGFLATLDGIGTLERLHLAGNPWECNCQSLELQRFMRNNFEKVNSTDVYCQEAQAELIHMDLYCHSTTADYLPVFLLLLICLATCCALYYRFQTDIKVYLFTKNLCFCLITEEELDKDKSYDVFISYCNQDEAFVMDHLVAELEKGDQPYKVCIHTRDWVPGELIMDQISYSVQESKRTLVVLSNSFVDSVWGRMEFRAAHAQSRVVVVVCDGLDMDGLDAELKNYLRSNTYVKWGERYFWDKLKYALPHSRNQMQ